ncbi:MAG: hypothetical protein H6Q85_2816, partial [candidate division NC10 bacterium]|nr:hypothetical protein [candidate division NC10 bacterium]
MRHYGPGMARPTLFGAVLCICCICCGAIAVPAWAQDARSVLQSLQDAFVQVAQAVKPAVVN